MKFFVGIIAIILVFIGVNALPSVQDYYDKKAFAYLEQGELEKARRFYFPGKIRGDLKAANNYHVLNYRISRYSEGISDKKKWANRKKAFRAFDKLTQKGYVPAAYNAGMFYFRSPASSSQFNDGLKYLDHAAARGDELSRDAAGLMRARKFKKEKRATAYRKAADDGNGLAAYLYVKSLRFEKKKLRRAEKYALMGAEAGYADAQQFLTTYFPNRRDRKEWLEKAATNKDNRSIIAAYDLATLEGKKRNYDSKRKWLTLASTPREKFKHHEILDGDVLRWRGLQNSIMADINNSKKAAYELAFMQMDGIGGEADRAGAIKSLTYAEDWQDAPFVLSKLKSGAGAGGKPMTSKTIQMGVDAQLKKFDTQKHRPYYEKLRPYVKSGQIRYATGADVKKYRLGVATTIFNEKYKIRGGIEKCNIDSNCFYMEKSIILPNGMYGANAAKFLINPAGRLPKQSASHNTYIFLNERYVPRGAL